MKNTQSEKQLRILTYNIFHGEYVKGDVGAIGREIAKTDADIVGLQEVDIGTARMNGQDTLSIIAQAGGYPHYAFAKAIDCGGGEYGTAILSRYPIREATLQPLFSADLEKRVLAHALIDLGDTTLDFFNTHTSYESNAVRRLQLQEILAATAQCEHFILTGDLNTEDPEELALLSNAVTVNPGRFSTFYATGVSIDHIFLSRGFSCVEAKVCESKLSDHYPLWADVLSK